MTMATRFLVFRRPGAGYQWILHRDHEGTIATAPFDYATLDECLEAVRRVREAGEAALFTATPTGLEPAPADPPGGA
jgi:hypothetical protein